MPDLRLFVACELPDEVRRALDEVQDGLRSHLGSTARLRWVRPEGIHVTLKFLGAVDASNVDELTTALSTAIEPFELTVALASVGGFGGARLRVIWVGLAGDTDGLAALAGRVDVALEPLGFPRERRPFAAHLTLARVPDETPPPERRRLSDLLWSYRLPPQPSLTLTEVALMQSTLGPGGAVYRKIASFPPERS
jgi:2'-5' RNA ligase